MIESLLLPLGVSMGLNWLMFIPAFLFKTDKLTDISYSVTFAGLAIYGFIGSSMSTMHVIMLLMILLWSFRLGSYLLYRIQKMGHDARFDEMRNSFFRFLGFWTLQGLTVFIVSIPGILLFQSTIYSIHPAAYFGLTIFLAGLIIEALADNQKFKFKSEHPNDWVSIGLWKNIRHPNYLGEMMVWIGVYFFAAGNLQMAGALIALLSPVFIILLLRYVSGIPLLEKSALKKYGDNPTFQEYLKNSNRLIPKF